MKLHFFHYCLNKNSHPQPEKGRFILDKNLTAQNIDYSQLFIICASFTLFRVKLSKKCVFLPSLTIYVYCKDE